MSEEMWLRFSEAIALVRELRKFNDGKSRATVKRAVNSGEVSCSFTEQYIINEEKQAHQELTQSTQRDMAARGFKMSGSALDISRSHGKQDVQKRVGQRLRLLNDVGSPEFNEQLMLGNIRVGRGSLIGWLDEHVPAAAADFTDKLDRQTPAAGANGKKRRRRPKGDPVNGIARSIWGEAGPVGLERREILDQIIARLPKKKGEIGMDEKTIWNNVRELYKIEK